MLPCVQACHLGWELLTLLTWDGSFAHTLCTPVKHNTGHGVQIQTFIDVKSCITLARAPPSDSCILLALGKPEQMV